MMMMMNEESAAQPTNIATISSGFDKGDFLVREEQGKRLYFDFFEDAFNYAAGRGFGRMSKEEEHEWVELLTTINSSVEGGTKYNTGKLVMVLSRPVPPPSKATVEKATTQPKKQRSDSPKKSQRSDSPKKQQRPASPKKQQQPV